MDRFFPREDFTPSQKTPPRSAALILVLRGTPDIPSGATRRRALFLGV
jgi:hypothetical protein